MTVYNYFSLTTSDGPSGPTLSKQFRVVEGGYKPYLDKKQDEQTTVDGNIDISQGAIYKTYNFIVKVYEADPDNTEGEPWGTLADLEQFYTYNSPNGSPSNVLTMVDHYGNTVYVVFMGQFSLEPATINLEGNNAIYFLPVILKKVTGVVE